MKASDDLVILLDRQNKSVVDLGAYLKLRAERDEMKGRLAQSWETNRKLFEANRELVRRLHGDYYEGYRDA